MVEADADTSPDTFPDNSPDNGRDEADRSEDTDGTTRRKQARLAANVLLVMATRVAKLRQGYYVRLETNQALPMPAEVVERLARCFKCDPALLEADPPSATT